MITCTSIHPHSLVLYVDVAFDAPGLRSEGAPPANSPASAVCPPLLLRVDDAGLLMLPRTGAEVPFGVSLTEPITGVSATPVSLEETSNLGCKVQNDHSRLS